MMWYIQRAGTFNGPGENQVLDLSMCSSLVSFRLLRCYNFTVKFPVGINEIYDYGNALNYTFDVPKDGRECTIDTFTIDQVGDSFVIKSINNIKNSGIKINNFRLHQINSGNSLASYMLKNGVCDWVTTFHYCVAGWAAGVWEKNEFYEDMNQLSNGSIENLEFEYCPEKDLKFIKDFTNSKLVDISLLKPVYDETEKCISGFPNLEELTITNSITDVTSIGELKNLKRLNVSENKINKGIEALSGLTNLEYINLTNCSSLSQNRSLC